MNKFKLIDASLVEDGGYHYLDLTYEHEDQYRVSHIHFPKVRLPIEHMSGVTMEDIWTGCYRPNVNVEFGNGLELMLHDFVDLNGTKCKYTVKTIKEKTKKMTVAEIEKKLGYKIEIVAEK